MERGNKGERKDVARRGMKSKGETAREAVGGGCLPQGPT